MYTSHNERYDIGTHILKKLSFAINTLFSFCKSKFRKISKALDDIYNQAVSRHNLKPTATFFEKIHATLDSQLDGDYHNEIYDIGTDFLKNSMFCPQDVIFIL